MTSYALALLALVPLVAGTSAHENGSDTLTVALCDGGEITIDLGRDKDEPKPDCQHKACHAGTCREKQRIRSSRLI